jgi:hypothetical protein
MKLEADQADDRLSRMSRVDAERSARGSGPPPHAVPESCTALHFEKNRVDFITSTDDCTGSSNTGNIFSYVVSVCVNSCRSQCAHIVYAFSCTSSDPSSWLDLISNRASLLSTCQTCIVSFLFHRAQARCSSTSSHSPPLSVLLPSLLGELSSLSPVTVWDDSIAAGSSSSSSSRLARLPVGPAGAAPDFPAETSSDVSSINKAKMGGGTVFW